MGLGKNNTGLEEISQSVTNVENIATEIKTNVNEVKTDTEGVVLSTESIKAIVDEIQNRIGLTGDTGGSASAGSVMSKLNQIISTTVSGGGGWEIPSIKKIIQDGERLSELGMAPNTNYKLLVIPNRFALYQPDSGYDNVYANVSTSRALHYFYINNIQTSSHEEKVCYLPLCVPFYFKIDMLSYSPAFDIVNCYVFWLND